MAKSSSPICQTCRREPGYKFLLTDNKKGRRWKCKTCINRKSVSFAVKRLTVR